MGSNIQVSPQITMTPGVQEHLIRTRGTAEARHRTHTTMTAGRQASLRPAVATTRHLGTRTTMGTIDHITRLHNPLAMIMVITAPATRDHRRLGTRHQVVAAIRRPQIIRHLHMATRHLVATRHHQVGVTQCRQGTHRQVHHLLGVVMTEDEEARHHLQ